MATQPYRVLSAGRDGHEYYYVFQATSREDALRQFVDAAKRKGHSQRPKKLELLK